MAKKDRSEEEEEAIPTKCLFKELEKY